MAVSLKNRILSSVCAVLSGSVMLGSMLLSGCSMMPWNNSGAADKTYHIETFRWFADISNRFTYNKDNYVDETGETYFEFEGDNVPSYDDYVIISIRKETADEFWKRFQHCFLLGDYAAGKLPTRNICGYDFVEFNTIARGGSNDIRETNYVYRHELAGMTVHILIGDWKTAGGVSFAMTLFDHFEFKLPDYGRSDPPFDPENADYQTPVFETPLGKYYKVSTVRGRFNEAVYTKYYTGRRERTHSAFEYGSFGGSLTARYSAASEKYLYMFNDSSGVLNIYRIDNATMKFVISVRIEEKNEKISLPDDDYLTIYPIPDHRRDFFFVENAGGKETVLSCDDDILVSPDGQTIIMPYSLKFHIDPVTKELTSEPFTLTRPSNIEEIDYSEEFITEEHIYVVARKTNWEEGHVSRRVFEYDLNGEFIREIKDTSQEDMNWEEVFDFDGRLLVFNSSGNMLELWDKEGNYITGIPFSACGLPPKDSLDFSDISSFMKCGDEGDFILIYSAHYDGDYHYHYVEDQVYRIHIW